MGEWFKEEGEEKNVDEFLVGELKENEVVLFDAAIELEELEEEDDDDGEEEDGDGDDGINDDPDFGL